MKIGSLFSGIGGLELGLEWAGVGETIWQVEADPFCRKVLAKHWLRARRFEDVRSVGQRILDPVDLIAGGFPCQDISYAGKGAGLAGERSGLWWEFARILRELGPRFAILENVSALLARGIGDVLGTLASLGYDAQWDCIPATAVGAPHRRERVFVIAWRIPHTNGIELRSEQGRGEPERTGEAEHRYMGEEGVANADRRGSESQRISWLFNKERAAQRDDVDRRGGEKLADSMCTGSQRPVQKPPPGREGFGERSDQLADTDSGGGRQGTVEPRDPGGGYDPHPGEWPPAPDDMHAWGRVQAISQPSICRLADGLPSGLVRDRRKALKAYGNAVVPAVGYFVGCRLLELAAELEVP